jgi:hypothetical protein
VTIYGDIITLLETEFFVMVYNVLCSIESDYYFKVAGFGLRRHRWAFVVRPNRNLGSQLPIPVICY